ncbi:MAG: Crp/Fnr family transcriptional regulator [Ignavibacteria bacterium]|nr:Crp/Fnr family transcriptional regulator [Ignavibacteria bacterium]
MERIRKYIENTYKWNGDDIPTEKDWNLFFSKIIKQEFPKKRILIKAGQTENYLSFIEKGMARFYIPKEENDVTFNIVFDNGFLSAYDSFLTRTPSSYNIETLTNTVLWRITYDNLQTVFNESKYGNIIGRQASEELFFEKQKRELSLLNETAEQRYLNLFKEQPKLVTQIPLKYIASYIGITPQALSRIRKRIS